MSVSTSIRSRRLRVFGRSPLRIARLRRLQAALGPTAGLTCLDIGGDAGVISEALRVGGGTWASVETPGPALQALEQMVGERAFACADGGLPFEKNLFDSVAIVDFLEHVPDDVAFIRECHRVLKPAGRLVVHVPYARKGSLLRALRNLLGFADDRIGHLRAGYSESQIFEVLKDGFDVQESQIYSGFFAEFFELLAHCLACRLTGGAWDMAGLSLAEMDESAYRRVFGVWTFFRPLIWLGARLDLLLIFSRGHRLIVRAKRRLWIPRKTPVLKDGRSIAEATLGTRIGTASPLASAQQPPAKNASVRARR